MEITASRLERMLATASELGARKVIQELNLDKKQILQAEAYRTYGRKRISQWRENGEITPSKQGGRIYYDKEKLEELSTVDRLMFSCPED